MNPREGTPMARQTTFRATPKPRSAADKANPFFEFMSPAERKWAASNIKRTARAAKRAAKAWAVDGPARAAVVPRTAAARLWHAGWIDTLVSATDGPQER